MSERNGLVIAGAISSVLASNVFLLVLSSLTFALSVFHLAILVQFPSILLVGVLVGLVGKWLRAPKWCVVVGAAYGWTLGLLLASNTLARSQVNTDGLWGLLIDYAQHVVLGVPTGSLPLLIECR